MFTNLFFKYISFYHIVLYNKKNNQYALASSGVSYVFLFLTLFFPSILPFFRQDYKNMLFLLSLLLIFGLLIWLTPSAGSLYLLGYYICLVYIAFVYNKWYLASLVNKGYIFVEKLSLDNKTDPKVRFILKALNEEQLLKAFSKNNSIHMDAGNNNVAIISTEENLQQHNDELLKILPKLKSYFSKRFTYSLILFVIYLYVALNSMNFKGV